MLYLAGILLVSSALADWNQDMANALRASESFNRAGQQYLYNAQLYVMQQEQQRLLEEQRKAELQQARIERAAAIQREITKLNRLYRKAKTEDQRMNIELQINRLEAERRALWEE